jgi:hypothetical protein
VNLYSANALKQQHTDSRHVVSFRDQPDSESTSLCSNSFVLSREPANILTVFGLTWPGLKSTVYRTQVEHANDYTTDVCCSMMEYTNISLYHHWSCEFESRSGEAYSIQHYVIQFVSLSVVFSEHSCFPPPLTATIYIIYC